MRPNAPLHTRIDAALKDQVTAMDISVAGDDKLPAGIAVDAATHDAWFRQNVRDALADARPAMQHDDVEARFAKRRASARARERHA